MSAIAFSPDSSQAYVADTVANDVVVIATATNTVLGTIPLPEGSQPADVAVSPNGALLYVTNSALGTVTVINTATRAVTTNITVGEGASDVAFSPSGTRAYVTNRSAGTVSVINTATNAVVATIPVGPTPKAIAVTPDGSKVYVADAEENRVYVISTATSAVTGVILGVAGGLFMEVTSTRVYVVDLSGGVTVIDQASNAVLARIDTFSFTLGFALIPGNAPIPGATPTITTHASRNNLVGAAFTDTATVSGGASPTGAVYFTLYRDPNCVVGVFNSTNPLVGATATSSPFFTNDPGTFYWKAVYTGDANNNPAAGACNAPNETVVVSPFAAPPFTQTITGDFTGPLTVNAGQSVQLLNARVVGPVTVNPGGALTVTNSQISRGIVANDPGFLLICGSQISGPSPGQALGVSNGTSPVRIGDVARGCAGNRFAGSVNLTGNVTTTFSNNIVVGNVTVNNNGPGTTLVFVNNIMGNLACSGNNPPPQTPRVLQRNTVSGTRSGQCTGLF